MSTLASAALSSYIARQVTTGQPVVFDEIIFCNIPNLTTNNLASHLTMPNSNQIVYRQVVSQVGFVNENAVVYSVTMGTEIGDFDFNYIGLINRQLNLLAVGVYTNTIKKIKNKNGIQGNAITRSILLEFANAKQITNITIPAQTWQIDFTARLSGIDEKIRLTNRDLYGRAVFFDDSFLVKRKTGNQFSIQAGSAYIEGVRASITTAQDITASLPCSIYIDIVHHCTVTGAYQTDIKFLKQHQNDYVDSAGRQHYVQVLADIARNGDITDRRERDKKYIPMESKSDSTTSNSSDTVATSKAVKDVRDIAESKQSPATTLAGYGISDFKVGMIATDESINNYTTPGFYYFERRGSKAAEPYISSSGASLEVIALSNRDIVQRFYSSNSRSGYQERTYINGGWSSWANIKAITDNGTTSDMNYATNSGIYVAYQDTKNTPDGAAIWNLDVISYGVSPHQIARKRGSFETYERYKDASAWSEWKRTDGVDWSDVREAPTTLSGYGITNFKVEQSTSNADNFKTDGQYYFANGQNLPDNGAWHIEVVSGGEANAVRQIAHKTNDTKIKTRFFNGSSWSSWKDAGGDGMPVGAVVAFPKEITNPQGFLLANGTTFSQQTHPDLYRTLGNKNKLPNLKRSDVGMTAYFATDDIPDGWIAFDRIRSTVTQQNYPELYQHLVDKYGSINRVPLAEDRFIRNAATGLNVGQTQGDAIRNITGSLHIKENLRRTSTTSGAFRVSMVDVASGGRESRYSAGSDDSFSFDASRVVPTSNENRPKSIVLKLCIKAKNTFDDVRFWIKAFGAVQNAGALDASRLAQDIQQVRAEKADSVHTHTTSQITDFSQATNHLINAALTYQKIGNFEIRKYPDGTMIQTYKISNDQSIRWDAVNSFNWAVSFREEPFVIIQNKGSTNNNAHLSYTLAIREGNSATKCCWSTWDADSTPRESQLYFIAIGRWK